MVDILSQILYDKTKDVGKTSLVCIILIFVQPVKKYSPILHIETIKSVTIPNKLFMPVIAGQCFQFSG